MAIEKEAKTEAFSVRVKPSTKKKLQEIADKNYRSAAAEIEIAIDRHIASEGKKK